MTTFFTPTLAGPIRPEPPRTSETIVHVCDAVERPRQAGVALGHAGNPFTIETSSDWGAAILAARNLAETGLYTKVTIVVQRGQYPPIERINWPGPEGCRLEIQATGATILIDKNSTASHGIGMWESDRVALVRIRGFKIVNLRGRTRDTAAFGVAIYGSAFRVAIENITTFNMTDGVMIGDSSPSVGIHIRQCRLVNCAPWVEYDAQGKPTDIGRSQGIYVGWVYGLRIAECFIDRPGWIPSLTTTRTIFCHGMYIHERCTGVILERNIVFEAASHGVQLRPGGVINGLLCVDCPIGLLIGGAGSIEGGVEANASDVRVIEPGNIRPDLPRNIGIWLENVRWVLGEHWYIVGASDTASDEPMIRCDGPRVAGMISATIAWDRRTASVSADAKDLSLIQLLTFTAFSGALAEAACFPTTEILCEHLRRLLMSEDGPNVWRVFSLMDNARSAAGHGHIVGSSILPDTTTD